MDREFAERMYKDWLEIHHKEDNEKSQEEYNYYLYKCGISQLYDTYKIYK